MSGIVRAAFISFALVFFFPVQLTHGQQAGQAPTIQINVKIVVLDVVVLDKNDQVVQRPLVRDDFQVFENKDLQRIRSFEPPSAHEMPESAEPVVHSAADLARIGAAATTVLVLDELNSRFEDMAFARDMTIRYLGSQPAVLRQATLLLAATNTRFLQLHDWTQDRDALISVARKHMPDYPSRMMNSGRSGEGALERVAQGLEALQQIAQSSSGTPGRKNLIWIGNGFPTINLVGMPVQQADTVERAMRRATDELLAAHVTLYTIDPSLAYGSTVSTESPDDFGSALDVSQAGPFSRGAAFTDFAPSTGGVAFTGRNDINNLIAKSISEGTDYYTISYVPSIAANDPARYRRIKVRMKDPLLHAVTRSGYYPFANANDRPDGDSSLTSEQAHRNLELDISSALTSTMVYNGLDVRAAKSGNGQWSIYLPGRGISWSAPGPDGSQHSEATVAAAWFNAKDQMLGHIAREETSQRDASSSATYVLSFALPPGTARLRLLIRDAYNGRMGTADTTKF